jgi:hypothetical protein
VWILRKSPICGGLENRAGFWRLILDQITTWRRSLREAEGCLRAGAPTISHRPGESAETHPAFAVERSFMVILQARLWNLGGV